MAGRQKKIENELENEEQALLSSFEKGEWKSIKNLEKEKALARTAASKTLRKDIRINKSFGE